MNRNVNDHDYNESMKFLKGFAWAIGLSVLGFYLPLFWWLAS